MKTVWGLKRLRKRMFKDLERVIKARNLVLYNDVSEYSMVEVAKKIEDFAKYYAQAIGVMKEQLQLAEDNGHDIESSRFLYNYRALKDDTVEVVAVMFEMYTDVYNKIQEVMCDE